MGRWAHSGCALSKALQGKVAWITPPNAPGGRTQGVGVRFPNDEKTRLIKLRIEEILGTQISSSKPTQTF